MRAIRTDEYLYIRNFASNRWPMGSPNYQNTCSPNQQWLSDCDNGPSKFFMYANRDNDGDAGHGNGNSHADLYDLTFGKRPQEELYVLEDDPHQMNNVASENQDVVEDLRGRLMDELEATDDPRVMESGNPWGDVPYTGGYMTYPGDSTINQYEL
jgi:hypothetical protein